MEKLYFNRTVDEKLVAGNINVGLINENDIVRLTVYSDAFYLTDETTLKVELKRQNEDAAFEEHLIPIDKDAEHLLETFELGVRNEAGYDIKLSLVGEDGIHSFLNGDDEIVSVIERYVDIIPMTNKIDRPLAFLSRTGDVEGVNQVEVFAKEGARLIVADEGLQPAEQGKTNKQYTHKNVEKQEVTGTLFQKVVIRDTLDKSHMFFEVGPQGTIVVCYRREYFIGSLIAKEAEQDVELRGGVINGRIMYDVTPLIESFDFDIAGGMPERSVLKVGADVSSQTYASGVELEALVLEAKTYDKVNASGYMGYEKPAEAYALIDGAMSLEGSAGVISVVKGDYARTQAVKIAKRSMIAPPKLKSFYRGNDLHVVVYGEGDSALIVVGANRFKGKPVTGKETHFIFKDSKSLVGKTIKAVLVIGEDSTLESSKVVQDIEEIYPITPEVTETNVAKTAASFKFVYPSDNRYGYARLFKDGVVVRDKIQGAQVTIQALEPGTTYQFEIAFVDIEEYESLRVPVVLTTESSGVINYTNRIELKVDDIEITFKI